MAVNSTVVAARVCVLVQWLLTTKGSCPGQRQPIHFEKDCHQGTTSLWLVSGPEPFFLTLLGASFCSKVILGDEYHITLYHS